MDEEGTWSTSCGSDEQGQTLQADILLELYLEITSYKLLETYIFLFIKIKCSLLVSLKILFVLYHTKVAEQFCFIPHKCC